MADSLFIDSSKDKKGRYEELLPQLKALAEGESDGIANLANTMAALAQTLGFFWVGVYIVRDNELVLGPFQGPIACTRIQFGQGVCGTAWKSKKTIIVKDVNQFPGHIACSAESQSEIVVPVLDDKGEVVMVLDVDSTELAAFDEVDQQYLEMVANWMSTWKQA